MVYLGNLRYPSAEKWDCLLINLMYNLMTSFMTSLMMVYLCNLCQTVAEKWNCLLIKAEQLGDLQSYQSFVLA